MRILLIGAINKGSQPNGGEEYKNQLLLELLGAKYELFFIDTYQWRRKIWILVDLITSIFLKKWDRILISASSGSVYNLVRILSLKPNISSKAIYLVIGGYFPSAVVNGTYKLWPYNRLRGIVLEGEILKKTLLEAGYKGRVDVVPNFKKFPEPIGMSHRSQSDMVKFVFLSRITPGKGIELIIDACRLLLLSDETDFEIVFYGPIENGYEKQFKVYLNDRISYGGILDIMNNPVKSYQILSNYDVMLFPTYWKGEGFPGVIADAFYSGLPVIASDWNMNKEVISDEINGILIPPRNSNLLAEAMKRFIDDRDLIVRMSQNASAIAANFDIKNISSKIYDVVEL